MKSSPAQEHRGRICAAKNGGPMTTSEKRFQITQETDYEKKLELVDELTGEEAKEILKAFIRFQNRSEQ